jgi:putative transposase
VPQVRARSVGANLGPFWQARYYDRNVRDYEEFTVKLRYLHRNPVERGLVAKPEDWKWSSYRHYALRETGVVEIESQWTAADRERKAHGGPERIFLRPG